MWSSSRSKSGSDSARRRSPRSSQPGEIPFDRVESSSGHLDPGVQASDLGGRLLEQAAAASLGERPATIGDNRTQAKVPTAGSPGRRGPRLGQTSRSTTSSRSAGPRRTSRRSAIAASSIEGMSSARVRRSSGRPRRDRTPSPPRSSPGRRRRSPATSNPSSMPEFGGEGRAVPEDDHACSRVVHDRSAERMVTPDRPGNRFASRSTAVAPPDGGPPAR